MASQKFSELGADILFVEAPENETEMAAITSEAPGIHMANMLEGGITPILPSKRLFELGYNFAAYPLTLLSSSILAMKQALDGLAKEDVDQSKMLEFSELRKIVGLRNITKMRNAIRI